MSFSSDLVNIFFSDFSTTFIGVLIAFTIYKLSKFHLKVYSLPPRPLPLPVLGNILLFKSKSHWDDVIRHTFEKYGPVFTFWMANKPFIFIADIDIARVAFRKKDLAGRPDSYFGGHFSNDKHQDVVFTTYGPTWEALRRVAHSAAQKYSTNDKLVYLVCDSVDYTVEQIMSKDGCNKEINPIDYIFLLFLNILSTSAFGTKVSYSFEDEEFIFLKYALSGFMKEAGNSALLWEFSPLIRLMDRKMVKKHGIITSKLITMINEKFKTHYKDYDESIERDFCDALITAKNDALREGKKSAPHLKDANLAMAVFDLFAAGIHTSEQTFQWILIFIAYYSEIQKKLRKEIETQIGDRLPTHEDRHRCHYVMAFIAETLRLRNVANIGVPHCAVNTSKIGDYTIPKGNGIFLHQGIILTDEKHWRNAQQFRPERFLKNGKYKTTRPKAYIPFGIGRRVCLGEKLAIADLFLVVVRFLQSTTDYDIVLGANGGIEADPGVTDKYIPREYKIIFKTK